MCVKKPKKNRHNNVKDVSVFCKDRYCIYGNQLAPAWPVLYYHFVPQEVTVRHCSILSNLSPT